jgi:hypothetical protein
MRANEAAALWWSERLLTVAKSKKFHDVLLVSLDQLKSEWKLSADESEGILGEVISQVFLGQHRPSLEALFANHLAMEQRDDVLWIREGEGKPWRVLHW